MHKSILSTLILTACTASATVQIPADLIGRQIQFSYSPSWKFTPLLMGFGEVAPGKVNTYTIQGEDTTFNVTYTPHSENKKAQLTIDSKRDKATIQLTFHTPECGIAHMKWNGAAYYELSFRIQENTPRHHYLQRMGDPVGDVIPTSLANKVLEIDFNGAFTGRWNPDTETISYQTSLAAPMLIQFPDSGSNFIYTQHDGSPLSVQYELRSCGAIVSITGGQKLNMEISLDFADSESGLAHVVRAEGDYTPADYAARFRIRPVSTNAGRVVLQQTPNNDHVLADLIHGLENISYPTAVERLYQKRLLSILPQIAKGASVNTVLPNANGTTALHNACGLSHVELVQWLVNHGADIYAKTAKGADVNACVGGRNAKMIQNILQKAKSTK